MREPLSVLEPFSGQQTNSTPGLRPGGSFALCEGDIVVFYALMVGVVIPAFPVSLGQAEPVFHNFKIGDGIDCRTALYCKAAVAGEIIAVFPVWQHKQHRLGRKAQVDGAAVRAVAGVAPRSQLDQRHSDGLVRRLPDGAFRRQGVRLGLDGSVQFGVVGVEVGALYPVRRLPLV